MGILRNVTTLAILAASMSAVGHAQAVPVAGSTTGCFGSSCTTGKTSSNNGHGVSFTGRTASGVMTPGTYSFKLGSITFNNFSCMCGSKDFTLFAAFSSPTLTPNGGAFDANIHGAFLGGYGASNVNFDNTEQEFDFSGGSLFLSVNDLSVPFEFQTTAGTYDVTGQIRYVATTTPEPGSLALLGTGLFGLVPMVRRRRK